MPHPTEQPDHGARLNPHFGDAHVLALYPEPSYRILRHRIGRLEARKLRIGRSARRQLRCVVPRKPDRWQDDRGVRYGKCAATDFEVGMDMALPDAEDVIPNSAGSGTSCSAS